MTWDMLCRKYTTNTNTIHKILHRAGITPHRDFGWSVEKKELLQKMYTENATYPEMYKALGCKGGTLTYWVHKLGLPMRGSGRSNVYKNPFLKRSSERDYWLGYIFADGHVDKHNGISLMSYELEPIEAFNAFTGNICSISHRNYTLKNGEIHTMYRATIVSRELAAWFMDTFNISSKKSHNLDPSIELNWDIIRGTFDGDGWAGNFKGRAGWTITSNSKVWIKRLYDFIKAQGIRVTINTYADGCQKVCVYRKAELFKLVPLLYSNNTYHLKRKYDRLEPFMSNHKLQTA